MKPDDNTIESVAKWENTNEIKGFLDGVKKHKIPKMAGFKIIKQREINDTINASYFYSHMKQDIMFLVAQQDPTRLRLFMKAKSMNVANADDYRINMMWEVKTTDVHSN